jgi:hypothetical protein
MLALNKLRGSNGSIEHAILHSPQSPQPSPTKKTDFIYESRTKDANTTVWQSSRMEWQHPLKEANKHGH